MRKNNFSFLIVLFAVMLIPTGVFAAPPAGWNDGDAVSVCRNGCDYNSVDSLFDDISVGAYNSDYLWVEMYDSYEYKVQSHDLSMLNYIEFYSPDNKNINISGANNNVTLKVGELIFGAEESDNFTVKLSNLIINSTYVNSISGSKSSPPSSVVGTIGIFSNSIVDNVRINSKENGLVLKSYNQHNINGYVYNGDKYAILMIGNGTRLNERSINITNSKMAGCDCSLVIYDYSPAVPDGGTPTPSSSNYVNNGIIKNLKPSFISLTDYNIKVDNSDVSCVRYGADNSISASNPIIYFTSSNRWSKDISKCYVEQNGCNVLQGINSKIIIDQEDNVSVSLKDKVKLQDYFPELKSVNPKEITWSVSNPKVLKIVDGKAIPLKTGNCVVTATYNDMNYTLNFRVTNNNHHTLANPNTGARLFLIIAIVLFASGVGFSAVMTDAKNEN